MEGCLAASCMMPTHPSPVATLSNVKMAEPKLEKFAWRFIVSWSFISAKRDTPRTANRKRKRTSRAPTLASSGMARMKVWKIYCRFFAVLISLSTRAILNERMIVEMLPTSIAKT